MNYSRIIKDIRKKKLQLTQKEFSSELGITQSYLSLIENGTKKPSSDLIEKMGQISGTPLPIMYFKSLDAKDVSPEKRAHFNLLKEPVSKLLDIIS